MCAHLFIISRQEFILVLLLNECFVPFLDLQNIWQEKCIHVHIVPICVTQCDQNSTKQVYKAQMVYIKINCNIEKRAMLIDQNVWSCTLFNQHYAIISKEALILSCSSKCFFNIFMILMEDVRNISNTFPKILFVFFPIFYTPVFILYFSFVQFSTKSTRAHKRSNVLPPHVHICSKSHDRNSLFLIAHWCSSNSNVGLTCKLLKFLDLVTHKLCPTLSNRTC